MNKLVILLLLTGISAFAQCPAAMSTFTSSTNLALSVDSKICGLSGSGVPNYIWCTTALIGKARYVDTDNANEYACTALFTWTLKGATGPTGPTGPAGTNGAAGAGNNSYCPTGGTNTAYTCPTPTPVPTTLDGLIVTLKPHTANGTTPTLNVAGLGAKSLLQADCTTPVTASSLTGGSAYLFSYDGTSFCQSAGAGGGSTITDPFTSTGNLTSVVKSASSGIYCVSGTVAYNNAAWNVAAVGANLGIFTVATNYRPVEVVIAETTQFANGAGGGLRASVGTSANPYEFLSAFAIKSANNGSSNTISANGSTILASTSGTTAVVLRLETSDGSNLNAVAMTAGVLKVRACVVGGI